MSNRSNHSECPMSDEEYVKACELRDTLNKKIAEYENEFRRGCVKITRTKCGFDRNDDGYSVRIDHRLGRENGAYWKTLYTSKSTADTLEFLRVMARDFPAVYAAFKSQTEEETTNE